MEEIHTTWYKIKADLSVISQSEDTDFDHSASEEYVLWIEKSGPHGWFASPDIYDDPIYHYQFLNKEKNPIEEFHIAHQWYLVGMSTILNFRESGYSQFSIRDPQNVVKTYKLWSNTSIELTKTLCLIRDKIAVLDSWEAYEKTM